jgi:putative spermidine/putrescine transport system permease protein
VDEPVRGPVSGRGASLLRQLDRWRWPLLAVLPIGFALVIFGYPVLEIFRRSFTDFMTAGESGLANYVWYFSSDAQMTILVRTFLVALLVTGLCLLLGYPYAYLMTLVGPKARLILLGLVLMPFWTSLMVRTYSWVVLMNDKGPIMSFLHDLGVGQFRLLGSTTAVTIGMTQVMLPFMILPLYALIKNIDRGLLLAAQSLGAKPRVAFRRIYLPLSVPGVLSGSTIVFIMSLGFYFTPALLGSPRNSLISQQIVTQVAELLAFGRGGAMALVLLAITLVLLWLGYRAGRRYTAGLTFVEGER